MTVGGLSPNTPYYFAMKPADEVPNWSGISNIVQASTSDPTAVSTPTFSPLPGTYSSTQSVTVSNVTSGATTRYTTDGSTPTESSQAYTAPVSVSATATLKAKSWKSGLTSSAVASGYYEIGNVVSRPMFFPLPGPYSSPQLVTISNFTSGATIHYTTDGSTPVESSPTYTSPVSISATATLMARSWKAGLTASAVESGYYEIANMVSMPMFSPLPGAYSASRTVTISSVTSGATIHYTTDGSTPTESSPTYTSQVSISATAMLRAKSWKSGLNASAMESGYYEIANTASVPMFSPLPGTFSSAQLVTISYATPGATTRYTTNGSTPTESSPIYTSPLAISTTATLKAMTWKSGLTTSAVMSGEYEIQGGVSTLTDSPLRGAIR
jgi:N-acetyl-beta-hexosaminidase